MRSSAKPSHSLFEFSSCYISLHRATRNLPFNLGLNLLYHCLHILFQLSRILNIAKLKLGQVNVSKLRRIKKLLRTLINTTLINLSKRLWFKRRDSPTFQHAFSCIRNKIWLRSNSCSLRILVRKLLYSFLGLFNMLRILICLCLLKIILKLSKLNDIWICFKLWLNTKITSNFSLLRSK